MQTEVSVNTACQNSPWILRYSYLKFVCMKLFSQVSEKRPPGCNSGKLHADRNNFTSRQLLSNRKEVLFPWIVDGGLDTKIGQIGAPSEARRSIEVDEVHEKFQMTTLLLACQVTMRYGYRTLLPLGVAHCRSKSATRWRNSTLRITWLAQVWLAEPNPKFRRVEKSRVQWDSSQVT